MELIVIFLVGKLCCLWRNKRNRGGGSQSKIFQGSNDCMLFPLNLSYSHRLSQSSNAFSSLWQVRLAVAGAFHTSFMEPAVSRLEAALASTDIRTPRIPVISNVNAQPHADPDTIKKILARQVSW